MGKGKGTLSKSTATGTWEAFKKQFPKGAKVHLSAGGPTMAVKGHVEPNMLSAIAADSGKSSGEILCQWFSGKKLESGRFAPETLVLVKDDAEEKRPS